MKPVVELVMFVKIGLPDCLQLWMDTTWKDIGKSDEMGLFFH
jgi:hypothetical protein